MLMALPEALQQELALREQLDETQRRLAAFGTPPADDADIAKVIEHIRRQDEADDPVEQIANSTGRLDDLRALTRLQTLRALEREGHPRAQQAGNELVGLLRVLAQFSRADSSKRDRVLDS
jgi:hypothetical protein